MRYFVISVWIVLFSVSTSACKPKVNSAQRCVLSVSFMMDLLLSTYGSNKSTRKETGKTHLCAVGHITSILLLPTPDFIMQNPGKTTDLACLTSPGGPDYFANSI